LGVWKASFIVNGVGGQLGSRRTPIGEVKWTQLEAEEKRKKANMASHYDCTHGEGCDRILKGGTRWEGKEGAAGTAYSTRGCKGGTSDGLGTIGYTFSGIPRYKQLRNLKKISFREVGIAGGLGLLGLRKRTQCLTDLPTLAASRHRHLRRSVSISGRNVGGRRLRGS